MSLKNSTKIRIKKYILEKLELHDASLAKKVADNFGVSLTTVYRYIHELEDEGLIVKENNKYKLLETQEIKTYHTNQTLEEDKIFKEMMESVVAKHPDNVRKIWQYAFTEMMNNAIDLSLIHI